MHIPFSIIAATMASSAGSNAHCTILQPTGMPANIYGTLLQ